MAFVYTAKLQDRIALAVWNVTNSGLSANQKKQLDGTWTSGSLSDGAAYDAYVEIAQLAQWFEQASSNPDTSYPQDEWDRLFLAKASMILVKTVRPDRLPDFERDHEKALDESLDTFTRDLVSSTSLAGQGITLAGIRAFVIDHCVKRAGTNTGLRRRLFPSIAQIDGSIQWTLNYIWNKTPWHFRKRQVIIRVAVVSATTATWTESSKTLTSAGTFTGSLNAGARVLVTGGTGVLSGEYLVTAQSSDSAIVLDTSISAAGSDLTTGDISATVQSITISGMGASESFDAVMSRKLFYQGDQVGGELKWADATRMAEWKSVSDSDTGTPRVFRFERISISDALVTTWHLSPFPDQAYVLRCAVLLSGPGTLTTAASLVTAISRFPAEFGTVIRDVTLAKVLQLHSASDGDSMMRHAQDQTDFLLPIYADQGFASRMTEVEDVNRDYESMTYDWRL